MDRAILMLAFEQTIDTTDGVGFAGFTGYLLGESALTGEIDLLIGRGGPNE